MLVPAGVFAALVALVRAASHHSGATLKVVSAQSPDEAEAVANLGQLPDLLPIGGLSAAINTLPGAQAFFRDTRSNAISTLPGAQTASKDQQAAFPAASSFLKSASVPSTAVTTVAQAQGGAARTAPVAPGQAPVAAGPAAAGPAAATSALRPPTPEFYDEVTNLLTCKALEEKVAEECGSQPLYKALEQFGGNQAACNTAVAKIAELGNLFKAYFGPGGSCNTMLEAWKFQGHKSRGQCENDVRREGFSSECRLL